MRRGVLVLLLGRIGLIGRIRRGEILGCLGVFFEDFLGRLEAILIGVLGLRLPWRRVR